eukprot:TRINITY_DN13927_c0_g1_i1.p1 TRINITY_DN13927_c0_g1~~TRINITY_DN13927_c0_g1_i1.p1  ORF type:complete len:731 (+),score=157.20 TRINITY_DN13927_c0_g1_i1:141-2333(+)
MGSSPSKKASKVTDASLENELRAIFDKGTPEQAVELQLPTIIRKLNAAFEGSDFTAEVGRVEEIAWKLKNCYFIAVYEMNDSGTRTSQGVFTGTATLIGTDEMYRVRTAKKGSPQIKLLQTEHNVLTAMYGNQVHNQYFSTPTDPHARLVTELLSGPTLLHAVTERSWNYTEEVIVSVISSLLTSLELLHAAGYFHGALSVDTIKLPSDTSDPSSMANVKIDSFFSAEQFSQVADARVDIIALGEIAHILCTGVPASSDYSISQLDTMQSFIEWDSLSSHAKQFVVGCLSGELSTASDCSSHSWLTVPSRELSPLPLSDVTDRIGRYLNGEVVELTLPRAKDPLVTSPANASELSGDDDRRSGTQSSTSTRRRSRWGTLSEGRSTIGAGTPVGAKDRSSDFTKVTSPPQQSFPSSLDVVVRQLKGSSDGLRTPISPRSITPSVSFIPTAEDLIAQNNVYEEENDERCEIIIVNYKNYLLLQQVAEVLSRAELCEIEDTERSLMIVQGNHYINSANNDVTNIWLFREATIQTYIANIECSIDVDPNLDDGPPQLTEQLLMLSAERSSSLCRRVICEQQIEGWRLIIREFKNTQKTIMKPIYAANRLANRELYDRTFIYDQSLQSYKTLYVMAKDLRLLDELHTVEIDTMFVEENSARCQLQKLAFGIYSRIRVQAEWLNSYGATTVLEASSRASIALQYREMLPQLLDVEGGDNFPRNELDVLFIEFDDSN